MPGGSVVRSYTLTQKRAVFPAFSPREVTFSQMRKIGVHFIIYQLELEAMRRMIQNNWRMQKLNVHFVAMATKPQRVHLKRLFFIWWFVVGTLYLHCSCSATTELVQFLVSFHSVCFCVRGVFFGALPQIACLVRSPQYQFTRSWSSFETVVQTTAWPH